MIRRNLQIVLLAAVLFVLNHAGVISGAVAPPAGYRPSWAIHNLDIPQYLTWINALKASRDRILLPDYHAPWQTGPALFQPMFWVIARIPLPAIDAYYVFQFALYVVACFVLFYAASVFCSGRERWFALAVAFLALPIRMYGWMIASAFGSLKWKALFAAGLIDYGYDTADGLFRGGLSNSPTLTMGTIVVLLAMTWLARYLQTSSRKFVAAICALTFVSALMHPFELFLIIAASAAPLLLRRRIFEWVAIGVSGFLGVVPFGVLAVKQAWLRDAGGLSPSSFHPLLLAADFGLPFILIVYLLMLRFRMPAETDTVLRSWFLAMPVLFVLPGVPFPLHLLNGFAYCIGFLVVRRVACDKQIRPLLERNPRAAWGILGSLGAVALAALAVFYAQVWVDGRKADPLWLLSSVERAEQPALIAWVRDHSTNDALVFAPVDVAPWIATIPRSTFASHDLFSITYPQQQEQVEKILKGEASLADLVKEYGVRVAVVPVASKATAPEANWRANIGPWRIYEFPDAKMKPYPGIAVLDPSAKLSFRSRLFEWIATRR
ncbi:MAG: hypothetical protein LAO79_18460 [Acidobacteriia bacterium]|nr:hypothetical protein [Terriglobia bacterium]